jgi:hypothetical protein
MPSNPSTMASFHTLRDPKAAEYKRFTLQPVRAEIASEAEQSFLTSRPKHEIFRTYLEDRQNEEAVRSAKFQEDRYRVESKTHLDTVDPMLLWLIPKTKTAVQVIFFFLTGMYLIEIMVNWQKYNQLAGYLKSHTSLIYLSLLAILSPLLWLLVEEASLIDESQAIYKKLKWMIHKNGVVCKTNFDEMFFKSKPSIKRLSRLQKIYSYLQTRIKVDRELVYLRNQTNMAFLAWRRVV